MVIIFINKFVEYAPLKNDMGQGVNFEPDSSPCTWEHYKKVYCGRKSKIINQYNFNNLFFYNQANKQSYYTNKPTTKYNRLFAMHNETKYISINGEICCEASRRLGGECDFNFNSNKCYLFARIIEDDPSASDQDKASAKEQLTRCRKMHHNPLNFSLIEAMGNMQGFKGANIFDRLDVFVCELDRYFKGLSNSIIVASSNSNRKYLISYLDNFKDIYDYCNEIYFIEDKRFVDKIIQYGKMPIKNCKDVIRYMALAEEFWLKKEFYFLRKEYLTIDEYFQNGGESYSLTKLTSKIQNDFGCSDEDAKYLIGKCEERCFITNIGNDVYTR